MDFLKNFKKIQYDFTGLSGYASATDITANVSISDVGEVSLYTKYIIQEGERPDTVSLRLYGDPRYYWILFLVNPSLRNGLSAWPLSDVEMDRMTEVEYAPYAWVSGLPSSDFSALPVPDAGLPDIQVCNENWEDTGWRIVRKDQNRMGLILKRPEVPGPHVLNLKPAGSGPFYLRLLDPEGSWIQSLEEAGYPPASIEEGAVLMEYSKDFTYDLLQNSTYQYYVDLEEESQPISHYDAISGEASPSSLKRITWAEYETITNNRKRYIIVPRPEAVEEISKQFMRLIKR
jgi:hypothetical protein